jgi:hypothetical protein
MRQSCKLSCRACPGDTATSATAAATSLHTDLQFGPPSPPVTPPSPPPLPISTAAARGTRQLDGAAHTSHPSPAELPVVRRVEAWQPRHRQHDHSPSDTQLLMEVSLIGMAAIAFLACVVVSRRWTTRTKGEPARGSRGVSV